jgi:hypothetical protein
MILIAMELSRGIEAHLEPRSCHVLHGVSPLTARQLHGRRAFSDHQHDAISRSGSSPPVYAGGFFLRMKTAAN